MDLMMDASGQELDPGSIASQRELELEIQQAISRLSPKLRAIVVLRYSDNLSYDQMATSLGVSLGTVKSRLSRAHEALDRQLTPVLDRHVSDWIQTASPGASSADTSRKA